jgi:hypothetical protein
MDTSSELKSSHAEPITATTDETGRWAVQEVPAGTYGISASAAQFAAASMIDVELESGRSYDNLDLELGREGVLLSGVVSDIGGGPIGGAQVHAAATGSGIMGTRAVPVATVTDDEGKYEILLPTGRYHLAASHEFYVSRRDMVLLEAPFQKDFTLVPAAVIQGQVVSSVDGEPVPKARVRATGGGIGGDFAFSGFSGESTESDGEGRFTLRGLKSGALQVSASAEGFSSNEPTVVEIGIAETIDQVLVVVDPAFTISGFVVRKRDEKTGVAGVFVTGMNMAAQSFVTANEVSGPDGYFEIHGVKSGAYTLMAMGEDVVPDFMAASVSVEDADLSDVVLVTEVGVSIKGRVEPPQAGTVGLEIDGEVGMTNMFRAMALSSKRDTVGEDGSFEITHAPSGKLKLVVQTHEGSSGSQPVVIGDEDLEGIVVKLEARAKISGVVVDSSGAPMKGVEVSAKAKSSGSFRMFGSFDTPAKAADEEGRFELVGLDEGKYEMEVSDSRGELTWAAEEEAPTVEITGASSITNLRLVVKAPKGVISGVVRDADGQLLADAWVVATRGRDMDFSGGWIPDDKDVEMEYRFGESEEPVLTGPDGRFQFTDLREGRYRLTASSPKGGARVKKAGVSPGDEVELTLAPLASLSGVVTMAGAPVDTYRITLDGPMSRNKKVSDAKGGYRFDRLDPGSYKIVATSKSGSGSGKVVIGAETSDEVFDLKLSTWCSIRGKVLDARSEEPLEGLMVMTQMEASQDNMSSGMDMMMGRGPKTNAEGHFEVEGIGCGPGTLSFMATGSGLGSMRPGGFMRMTLEPGEDRDLGTRYVVMAPPVDPDARGTLGLTASISGADETAEGEEELRVASVEAKGPAEKAGLEEGDRILQVNGVAVEKIGASSARTLLLPWSSTVGDTVTLHIERKGKAMDIDIVAEPAEAPDFF